MKPATAPRRSNGSSSSREARPPEPALGPSPNPEEAPLQVMVPLAVKRQLAIMSAEKGESFRTLTLRGLRAIRLDVPDAELVDRRKRRSRAEGASHGAE